MRVVSLLVLVALAGVARGEHRVALLMGDDSQQLEAVAKALGPFGFRCESLPTPEGERGIKHALEAFAATTPTRGTALVYFHGRVETVKSGDETKVELREGDDGRGRYDLGELLSSLTQRGASQRHLVVVDSPNEVPVPDEVPESCLVTFTSEFDQLTKANASNDLLRVLREAGDTTANLSDGDSLTGPGTVAVAPPDEFVSGKKAGDEWVNARGIVFCWCPPGRYVAGSPEDEPGRYPDETQRKVVIEHGFWVSKYELTSTQNLRGNGRPPSKSIATHELHPLTMVNLDDARNMTSRTLTTDERKAGRLPDDWEYGLTTEDEWEYAARAGTRTTYSFGNDVDELPAHGNFADRTYYDTGDVYSNYAHRTLDDGVAKLAKVGSYEPNPWGLHDVHGNVAEWCSNGAVRGGSWVNTTADCRSAFRHTYGSRNEQNFIGYRLVVRRSTEPAKKPK